MVAAWSTGERLLRQRPWLVGIGQGDEPPLQWRPVPPGSLLYVHDTLESWSIGSMRCYSVASQQALIAILQQYACALWCLDEDGGNSEEAFDESVDALIRSLFRDTVTRRVVEELVAAVVPFFGGVERATVIRWTCCTRTQERSAPFVSTWNPARQKNWGCYRPRERCRTRLLSWYFPIGHTIAFLTARVQAITLEALEQAPERRATGEQ